MAKTTYNRYGRTHISEESVQNRRSLMMGNRYRNLREEDETEDQETEDQDGADEGDEDTDSGEETVTIELTKSEAETLKATLEKISNGDDEGDEGDDTDDGDDDAGDDDFSWDDLEEGRKRTKMPRGRMSESEKQRRINEARRRMHERARARNAGREMREGRNPARGGTGRRYR